MPSVFGSAERWMQTVRDSVRSQPLRKWGQALPPRASASEAPLHAQCDPVWIREAIARAKAETSAGHWYVIDGVERIGMVPSAYRVCGRDVVAWRDQEADGALGSGFYVAPERCPHLGASLVGAVCEAGGRMVCPWHGLVLGGAEAHGGGDLAPKDAKKADRGAGDVPKRARALFDEEGRVGAGQALRKGQNLVAGESLPEGQGAWRHRPVFHDGHLLWAWLGPGQPDAPPHLSPRPRARQVLHASVRLEMMGRPDDVLFNRLDPWHGATFHPHSFASLRTLSRDASGVTVRVAYRLAGPLVIEVDAHFDAPHGRCVRMSIVRGEGEGSVVETHATPVDEHRTAVVELVLATSSRPGFARVATLQPLLRHWMAHRARRLWQDDKQYVERLAQLRG